MCTVTRRPFLALLAASLLFVGALPALHAAAPVERLGRVTLLQLNDLYDIMPVEEEKKGGLARIAALRDRIAKETPDPLLVLMGDGDGYTMLQQAKVLMNPMSGPMDSDLILDRLKIGPLAPATDGRIRVAP